MSHTSSPPPPPEGFSGTGPPSGSASSAQGHDAEYLHNPETAHEHSDVDIRTIIGFSIALFVVVVVVYALMGALFKVFESQAAKNDPQISPLTRPAVQMPTSQVGEPVFGRGSGGPQLLTSEPTVLMNQRTTEQQALSTYGWIDEKAGVARIPISEAKKLILQRGLPARPEPADPILGTRRGAFGESSSGRIITSAPAQDTKGEQMPPAGEQAAPAPKPKPHGQ